MLQFLTVKSKILFLFIFFISLQSFAQRIKPEKYIGLKTGGLISAVNLGIVEESLALNTGITSGIGFRYFNYQNVGLQLELNYTTRGGRNFVEASKLNNKEDATENAYFGLDLRYIEFPFLMHLRLGSKKNMLKFNFGSYASYTFWQKITFEQIENIPADYQNYSGNKFEYGINIGIAYGRRLKNNTLDFEVRYCNGLTNIYKKDSINSAVINQNQAVTFCLVYYWNLSNKKKYVKNN